MSDLEALAELGSWGWHILMFFTLVGMPVRSLMDDLCVISSYICLFVGKL